MAVAADATGSFKVNATSFNGWSPFVTDKWVEESDERYSGVDGSLKFNAKVDATGTGNNFVAMNMATNGNNVSSNRDELEIGDLLFDTLY